MDYLGHIHENSSLKYMYTFLTMTEVVVIFGNFLLSKSLECPCTYPGVCRFCFCFLWVAAARKHTGHSTGHLYFVFVCVCGREGSKSVDTTAYVIHDYLWKVTS